MIESNAVSGNMALWEEAYTANFDTLCSRARQLLTNGNLSQAEDAVSDAFVRIMRYVPNPQKIDTPESYWWTTVKRVWVTQQARPEVAKTASLDEMEPETVDSLPAVQVEPEIIKKLEAVTARKELRIKLGPLSLEERTLIQGRLEGYSFGEIAEQLGENVKLTRFRWHKLKARQRYRANKLKA